MQQISITPGVLVLVGNKKLEIIASVSSNKIQARDIVTGEAVLLSPGEIECELKSPPAFSDHEIDQIQKTLLIEDVKETDLQLASERFNVLSPMVGKSPLSRQDMAQCTAALGMSASQVRRLLTRLD